MTSRLETIVVSRLHGAGHLDRDARAVAHAALSGANALNEAVRLIPATADWPSPLEPAPQDADIERAHIYLTHISASGFRGVGERVDLPLTPTPGLVLVTGRNGSGKSSLAEACELSLSKSISRAARSPMWGEGLANLHNKDLKPQVEVGLQIDGVGEVVLACTLQQGDLASAEVTSTSGDRQYDLNRHGWDDAVTRYRPLLTYGELAALASAKPSDLFDPINNIIGLDELTAADQLLVKAGSEYGKPKKAAAAALKLLLTDLKAIDDPRAAELLAALTGRSPNIDAARAVLAGTGGSSTEMRRRLEAWTMQTHPKHGLATEAAAKLAVARDRVDALAESATGRLGRLADLLDLAIAHRDHDDGLCPICGKGQLDEAWLNDARRRSREARDAASGVTAAADELHRARAAARRLVTTTPDALLGLPVLDVDPRPAAVAWAALEGVFTDQSDSGARDRAVIDSLPKAVARVAAEVDSLAAAAAAALAAQNTIWEPIAEQAIETLRALELVNPAELRVSAINAARSWLRELTIDLRQQRMTEFEAAATTIWKDLRQESNVSLDGISLSGANTRRQVQLDLTVDGTPGPQSVLSQGELAALGLALFLPRSTAAESPFRFVVIDDPIQSMDPSKVDGLARVLHHLAADRQVIVFTHDDRLLQALRNLALPATAFKIVRGERSEVHVQLVADPIDQHLRDARALVKNSELPLDLVAIAVTGYCRDAIDETALDLARRRLFRDGKSGYEVETKLAAPRTTWTRLALAILGNQNYVGDRLNSALDAIDEDATAIINLCVEGVHEPDSSQIKNLPDWVGNIVGRLRAYDTAAAG